MTGSGTSDIDIAEVDALRDWMIDGAPPSARAGEIVTAICERLTAANVPVDRFGLFIFTLHPNIKGRRFKWTKEDGLTVQQADIAIARSTGFRASIAVHVMETGNAYRCRFAQDDELPPFPDVIEIRDEGMSD